MSTPTPMRIIDEATVASVISLDDVIAIVEQAFARDAAGQHIVFPVVRERLPAPHTGIFGIKSGLAGDVLGLKAGGFFAANRGKGNLPHQSTIVLFDPDSGRATAVIGANLITGLRTGAAGALGAKHVARHRDRVAAIIGCGAQGRWQLRALSRVRELDRVVVWDRTPAKATAFAEAMAAELRLDVAAVPTVEAACAEAGLLVTTTPGAGPVVMGEWIRPGHHISAIGADTAGKRELDPAILARAILVADNAAQSRTIGEGQFLPAGKDVFCELGQIIAGTAEARTGPEDITVFDATGVNFQDLVVAQAVLERCVDVGLGTLATL